MRRRRSPRFPRCCRSQVTIAGRPSKCSLRCSKPGEILAKKAKGDSSGLPRCSRSAIPRPFPGTTGRLAARHLFRARWQGGHSLARESEGSEAASKYDRLIAATQGQPPVPTIVVHPCDETSLRGAIDAARAKIIEPIFVGPESKIRAVAANFALDISRHTIVDMPHSHAAAAKAVELVREGKAEMLMKGSLHTDELMREVTASATGLRTERRISHVFVMDVPGHADTLLITDAAINIFPD